MVCHVDNDFVSPLDLIGYRIKDNSNAQVPDLYDNLDKKNKNLKDDVDLLKKWKADLDKDKGGGKPFKTLETETPIMSAIPGGEPADDCDNKQGGNGSRGQYRLGAAGSGGRKPFYIEKKLKIDLPLNPWDRASLSSEHKIKTE